MWNLLTSFLLLYAPVEVPAAEVYPAGVRIQIYPYGGYYYSYPPCPYGYYRYGGRCYVGRPGYYYYYGPRYYYYPYYRHHHRGHRRHHRH